MCIRAAGFPVREYVPQQYNTGQQALALVFGRLRARKHINARTQTQ